MPRGCKQASGVQISLRALRLTRRATKARGRNETAGHDVNPCGESSYFVAPERGDLAQRNDLVSRSHAPRGNARPAALRPVPSAMPDATQSVASRRSHAERGNERHERQMEPQRSTVRIMLSFPAMRLLSVIRKLFLNSDNYSVGVQGRTRPISLASSSSPLRGTHPCLKQVRNPSPIIG